MNSEFLIENSITIDRRENLSYRAFVNEYLEKDRPVIISGAFDNWGAMRKWTPEFFKSQHSEKELEFEGKSIRLGDFIDRLTSIRPDERPPYLSGIFIRDVFPEIADDILPDLSYTLPDRLRSRWMLKGIRHCNPKGIPELLITGPGGQFPLHYDINFMLGFVTQIYGNKEFIVFPPDQSQFLYPKPSDNASSEIDNVFCSDILKFPLLEHAKAARFTLKPGDLLFHPPGWWHTTRITDLSIAMVISTVSARNWNLFCSDILLSTSGKKWKAPIKKAYIATAHTLMTMEENQMRKRLMKAS